MKTLLKDKFSIPQICLHIDHNIFQSKAKEDHD